MSRRKLGVWFVGAKGGVATTTILGMLAIRKGLSERTGLTTELPMFAHADLAGVGDFAIGGHDIRAASLYDEAMKLVNVSHALSGTIVEKCKADLDKIDKNIADGTLVNVGRTIENLAEGRVREGKEAPRGAIERIQNDLRAFTKKMGLDQLVVVNVASTEPPIDETSLPTRWKELEKLLDKPRKCPLAASSLYAIAAIDLGLPYINFTPSLGSAPAAIGELAIERDTCHMGHDGKTGETLLKSCLAPMFAGRNLEVMSWVGHNIFGNMDGKVLDDPANKKTKVQSKDRLLHKILGYSPQTLVSIEYIESLGDWKTAWDHIHFKGFLGTPMVLQFTWQGCDSILAAPLVIDLVRLTERAHRAGERGLMPFLSCFFKSPLGQTEHNFVKQFALLENWAQELKKAS